MAVLAFLPWVPYAAPVVEPAVATAATIAVAAIRYAPPPVKIGGAILLGGLLVYEVILAIYNSVPHQQLDVGLINSKPNPRSQPINPQIQAVPTGTYSQTVGNVTTLRLQFVGISQGAGANYNCNYPPTSNPTHTAEISYGFSAGAFGTLPKLSSYPVCSLPDGSPDPTRDNLNNPGLLGVTGSNLGFNGEADNLVLQWPQPGPGFSPMWPTAGFTWTLANEPASPDPNALPIPANGGAMPGFPTPDIKPLPRTRKIPAPDPAVVPQPGFDPLPQTQPSPVPQAPGIGVKPNVGTGIDQKIEPLPFPKGDPLINGDPQPKPKPKPKNTDPTQHLTPLGPVVANPPQPKPETIAQELSRQEQKLNLLASQPLPDFGFVQLIEDLVNAILNTYDSGYYQATAPCDKDTHGNPLTQTYPYGGTYSAFTNLSMRVDAIAHMLQDLKNWKQPICVPKPATGQRVTVHFESVAPSPNGEKKLRKILKYRDQTGTPLIDHVNHWKDFEWQAGGTIVCSTGAPWGQVKVWADTEGTGQAVIYHAAAIAGVNLNIPEHRWIVSGTDDPRYGQPGLMRVKRFPQNGGYYISKRDGDSGPAEYAIPQL